jgi:hypothetical protein
VAISRVRRAMICPSCKSQRVVAIRYGLIGYSPPRHTPRRPDQPTDEICSTCGRPMVIRHGRFGRFVACTGFPECKNTRSLPNESTDRPQDVLRPEEESVNEQDEDGEPGDNWIGGGCVSGPDSPSHACLACGRRWLDPSTPEGRAELRRKRRYESMRVPNYLRPLWPAWDDVGAHVQRPGPFLSAARRYRSLAHLWRGTKTAEWMLWVYGRALAYGLVGGMYDGTFRDFACWAARRGLDTLGQLPGTTRGPLELSAILDMVRRQRQGLATQAAVEDALWEEEKYVRRSQDHKGHPYLTAFRTCEAIVSRNGVVAAREAAALAQKLAGYQSVLKDRTLTGSPPTELDRLFYSSEGSVEWVRPARRESAEQAAQLREMLGHPFVRVRSASPLIEIAAVRR